MGGRGEGEAAGYKPIADQNPGFEFLVNWAYLNDKTSFDANHPDRGSIYRVQGSKRTLVSAIYMLAPGTNVRRLPDIGGPLAPWDTHDNLVRHEWRRRIARPPVFANDEALVRRVR